VVAVLVLLVGVHPGSGALCWFEAALAPDLFRTLLACAPSSTATWSGCVAPQPSGSTSGELGSNLVALGGLLVSSTALRRFMSNRSRAKVSGNQLVGFEPRYYFAFNERPRAC
jgi:hypothetical protein